MFLTHAHDICFPNLPDWYINQSCYPPIEANVAFIHSIRLEATFVNILYK